MKISHMLLFMLAIFAGLAYISENIPPEGIQAGPFNLTFPKKEEALYVELIKAPDADSTRKITPEDIIRLREQALRDDKEYVNYMENDPARIHLPYDDYLDPVFTALDSASKRPIRIMHYGDSQIEMDRISCYLRERFQQEYGGMGAGLMPALQTVPTFTISQSITPSPVYYLPYTADTVHQVRQDKDYGPMARCALLSSSAKFTCRPNSSNKNYRLAGKFRTFTVLAHGNISATCSSGGRSIAMQNTAANGAEMLILKATFPDTVTNATISLSGSGLIYGIAGDGVNGVSLDNVPMRGCTGTIFTRMKEDALREYYSHYDVSLIILQYGGNAVPGLNSDKSISSFKEKLRAQIQLFKRLSPKTRILFIGPADMAKSVEGSYRTYSRLPQVIDSIRAVSIDEGIAFWNMYDAMGGYGSMVQWVKSGLAGKDYLHFSNKGASEMARILYETLTFIRNHRKKAEQEVNAMTMNQ